MHCWLLHPRAGLVTRTQAALKATLSVLVLKQQQQHLSHSTLSKLFHHALQGGGSLAAQNSIEFQTILILTW